MRLGVLGTLVWDRIDHPDVPTVERWGGIAYSLAAATAAAGPGTLVRPLVRVGADLAPEARAFLATLPGLETDPDGAGDAGSGHAPGVVVVPEANNRVHLRYRDREHRHEQLSGGVGGWTLDALLPRVRGLDALYVNLIAGFELSLDTALGLRRHFNGPIYADLHSLLLDVAPDGGRVPRRLPDRDAWLDAFDVVQVNEGELALVAGDDPPDDVAHSAAARGGAVLVTLGSGGARWFARSPGPRPWAGGEGVAPASPDRDLPPVARGTVAVAEPRGSGDPTGCGDVWGATCFVRLLEGRDLTEAMAAANRAAAANVNHRGADGLYEHLRSQTK